MVINWISLGLILNVPFKYWMHFCCKEKALFFQKLNELINYLHHCQFVSLDCLPNLILWYCKRFLEESPLIFIFRKIQDLLIQGNGTYYLFRFLSARKRQLALLVIVFVLSCPVCLSPLKPKYLLISIICVMTHHVKDSNSNSKHIKYKRPTCSKEFPKNPQKIPK